MDPPVVLAYRRGLANMISDAPREVVMADDERLRVTLAHYREGLNTPSPFFGFLGFWNALDVACEDHPGALQAWVEQTAGQYWHLRGASDPAPADTWDYLNEASRNAVAHAVRYPGRPALDPDAPEDRARLSQDKRLVQSLVDIRVRERWGDYAVYEHRRRDQ
jgi:Methylamine utilization protein MauJ